MRVPILLPDVGAGDERVRVSSWLIDEGDWVIAGDLIVEVLIPGITFDVVSESTGRLVEIAKDVDAIVRPGDILGWIESTT